MRIREQTRSDEKYDAAASGLYQPWSTIRWYCVTEADWVPLCDWREGQLEGAIFLQMAKEPRFLMGLQVARGRLLEWLDLYVNEWAVCKGG